MTASAQNRRPSAVDALGEAISHMRARLFPFSFMGWLTLAFVSLLESCGSSGGTGTPPGSGNALGGRWGGPSGSVEDPVHLMENLFAWVAAHMILLVGVLLAVMLVSLVFLWLRSRMIFVYIDDVATGRFDLSRPWTEHSAHADSFFGLSLIVQGASFILMILILAIGAFFAIWARAHDLGMGVVLMAALPLVFLFFVSIIAAGLLNLALRDFVAPLQLARDIGARDAWGVFMKMVSASPGLLIGYAVLKFVVGIATGIGMAIIGCLTCCIGFLPLVSQMLFQPILYAERAWSIKLLAQMGEDVGSKLMPRPSTPPYDSPSDALTGPIDLSAVDFDKPFPGN